MKPILTPRFLDSKYGYYYLPSFNQNQLKLSEHYKHVLCPKCNSIFKFDMSNENYHYCCNKCNYKMKFIEYQRRFNNLNWSRIIKKGISLYSWKDNCPNCKNSISHITYCINNTFGDESLCIFEPILLGKCSKLDDFIINVCNVVNMFPDDNNNLCAHIFCRHCDAPVSYKDLLKSFLNQPSFRLEYVLKNVQLANLNIEPEDINSLLVNLERY